MNGKCFEIGTIQAFLDGETSPDVSLRLSEHVAGCDSCARQMAEAEEQSSLVFSALERELNTLVPTQRLWSRINETIEVEKNNTPVWQRVLTYISVSLASPSFAAAAGILLVLGIFAIYTLRSEDKLVADLPQTPGGPKVSVPAPQPDSNETTAPSSGPNTPMVAVSNLKDKELQKLAQTVAAKSNQRTFTAQPAVYHQDQYVPGEESYIKTIADLKQNVDQQKETVLTPSTRVSYERDMAVVNDSIKRMRDVVRKNPKNQAARQVLYASYQDKIDLLNSVAQREELMASLR